MHSAIDLPYLIASLPRIISTVPLTLYMLFLSGFFSLIFGALITYIRIRRIPVLYSVTSICLSFFRSIPNILNILLVYYGMPVALGAFGIELGWEKSTYCIIALTLVYGCFVSEYLRPAWLAIGRETHDAADAIGMNRWQKARRIIIPLAFPIALPPLGNASIDMLKDTSVLFIIGLPDIMGRVNSIVATDYGVKKLEIYMAGGLVYATLILSMNVLFHLLEVRYCRFQEAK